MKMDLSAAESWYVMAALRSYAAEIKKGNIPLRDRKTSSDDLLQIIGSVLNQMKDGQENCIEVSQKEFRTMCTATNFIDIDLDAPKMEEESLKE